VYFLDLLRERNTGLSRRLLRQGRLELESARHQVESRLTELNLLGPAQTLARGYAILQNQNHGVVGSVSATTAGETLSALLADGSLRVRVLADQ
jgi:exodeoxyribonuclease VII large subunit